MLAGKIIGIDARMIEHSGIGIYIQHQLNRGIYDVAVGNEARIRKYDRSVKVIPFEAPVYSPQEQLLFPEKELRKANVSLMHFPHYNVPVVYRGRYVVTVHDLIHLIFPEFLGSRAKYLYAKAVMTQALKRSDRILTVSENSKQDILKYFPKTEKTKISVVGSSIDDDFGILDRRESDGLCSRFNIPRGKRLLLYVGNLKPHKNLRKLLEAFSLLNREDTLLILAGKAFQNFSLSGQEKDLEIQDRVIHTGLISKEELIGLYNLADVFVFPSRYEGFGLPPLEAMACGTPVVASSSSSIPEVVGDAALLVDEMDAAALAAGIQRLLDDPALAREYIRRGLKRCRFLTPEDVMKNIQTAMEMVIKAKQSK